MPTCTLIGCTFTQLEHHLLDLHFFCAGKTAAGMV